MIHEIQDGTSFENFLRTCMIPPEAVVSKTPLVKPSNQSNDKGEDGIETMEAKTVVKREKNRLTIGTTDSFDKAKY